jgi:hypothetical protein
VSEYGKGDAIYELLKVIGTVLDSIGRSDRWLSRWQSDSSFKDGSHGGDVMPFHSGQSKIDKA